MKFVALHSYFLWPYATGGERTVLDILTALQRAGHDVLIRYAIPPGLPDRAFDTFCKVISRFGLPIRQCSRRRVEYQAGDVPVEALGVPGPPSGWIGTWLDELAPDVVIAQVKDLLLLPALTAFWKGKGYILVQDEEALRSLTSFLTPVAISRVKSASISMVASSRFLQRQAVDSGFAASLLYPALTLLPPAPSPGAAAPITSFGTSPEKGFDTVTALAARMSDHSFRVVTGWNDTVPPADLPNLEFVPFALDPYGFYRQSSIVLAPSRCREGFGRVVHEAMAAGRVPVVSEVGALPEVANAAGVVLPVVEDAMDLDEWETALRSLLRGDSFASRIHECRMRAEALTTISRDQFLTLFGTTWQE